MSGTKVYCCYGAYADVGHSSDCPSLGKERLPTALRIAAEPIMRTLAQPLTAHAAKPLLLKGIGKINGDGWKDTTRIGEVVYAWNRELPEPYKPGQFPRLGSPSWSASTDQYAFRPVEEDEAIAVIDKRIEELRMEAADLRDELRAMGGFSLLSHLRRQIAFSVSTFGPGDRTAGVCDHIRKELAEVQADAAAGKPTLSEWVDVIILAFDGAWRSGASPEEIVAAIVAKQTKNEGRTWPDWRTADPGKAIEHDRSGEAPA